MTELSVIIPVFNCEKFLPLALESVQRQGHDSIEILVVDDGSTDRSASIAKTNPLVKYHFQSNEGPAAARNLGLNVASGQYIGFLDADDIWPDNKLELQLTMLRSDPELEAVVGRVQLFGDITEQDRKMKFEGLSSNFLGANLGAGLFTRTAFDRIGRFDPTLLHYEDYDWFMRARELDISMVVIKEVTLRYRRHSSSISQNKDPEQRLIPILQRAIHRRKGMMGVDSAKKIKKLADYESALPRKGTKQ